jgi:gluconolactonase
MKTAKLDYRVITDGLDFPEGPIAMPDGSVLVVEIKGGRLIRVLPDGSKEVAAELGGGPTGAAIGPDGACYVANNGGFHWLSEDIFDTKGYDLVRIEKPQAPAPQPAPSPEPPLPK